MVTLDSEKKNEDFLENFFKKGAHFFYEKLVRSKQGNEDKNRREFILNIVLLCVIFISFVFTTMVCLDRLFVDTTDVPYRGMGTLPIFIVFVVFMSLYFLVRKGFFKFTTTVVLSLIYLMTTYTMYHWGFDTPMIWIAYALIIVIANVLTEFRVAMLILCVIFLTIFTITNLQLNGVMEPLRYWKVIEPTSADSFQLGITLGVIAVLSWLSNYEITKSLKRARESEKKLKQEMDLLETRARERTQELQKMQIEKMSQLYRFAEFGKLSSGLFHDITNHLTTLFLNLENLEDLNEKKRVKTIRNDLNGVFDTKKKLEDFLGVVWNQLQEAENKKKFSLNTDIGKIIEVMQYNACKNKVDLIFNKGQDIIVFNSPVKFSQAVTNLIMNAIDSYPRVESFKNDKNDRNKRVVEVSVDRFEDTAIISVRDWGEGISSHLMKEIFNPFFSTKQNEARMGAGIGLFSTKEAIENSFRGTVEVESSLGEGTRFVIKFKA